MAETAFTCEFTETQKDPGFCSQRTRTSAIPKTSDHGRLQNSALELHNSAVAELNNIENELREMDLGKPSSSEKIDMSI